MNKVHWLKYNSALIINTIIIHITPLHGERDHMFKLFNAGPPWRLAALCGDCELIELGIEFGTLLFLRMLLIFPLEPGQFVNFW